MTKVESESRFRVRVKAARLAMKVDRMLDQPSEDWIVALVEEGERREREARTRAESAAH